MAIQCLLTGKSSENLVIEENQPTLPKVIERLDQFIVDYSKMGTKYLELTGHEWQAGTLEGMKIATSELFAFAEKYAKYFSNGNSEVANQVFGSFQEMNLERLNLGTMRSYFLNPKIDITTSLQSACNEGLFQAVKAILESGRVEEITREEFGEAIYLAASMGHSEIQDSLLESKKEAIIPFEKTLKAFSNAVVEGSSEKVKCLMKKQMRISQDKLNLLMLTAYNRQNEVIGNIISNELRVRGELIEKGDSYISWAKKGRSISKKIFSEAQTLGKLI